MSENNLKEGIFDARQLGIPKMLILGIQHTFAMFGATVLVPLLTGLDVATTLLMAGLGTLVFHLCTKGQVPVFLGSSFAFLGGYAAVAPMVDGVPNVEKLPYAAGGVFCAGLVYVAFSALIKVFGAKKVMKFFPPVVTGPIIIAIGLILAPSAINNCATNWTVAFIALATIIICNIWGKGMIKIVPIIIGILVSYAVALAMGEVSFEAVANESRIFALAPITMMKFDASAIITIMPIALATVMEHIGDISAISATTGKNYIASPGLHRTLLGDGIATSFSAAFGGPANTTYGENTGVLALTRVYDPRVIQIAAVTSILLSCLPKFSALVNTIPASIIGGVSLILYGMISAIGVRNVVENQVDFTESRNLIIAAVILVSALGFNSIGGITFHIAGAPITLSGLALAAIAGIVLNAILPGNTYEFNAPDEGSQSINFKV
ncbi:MAG: uracil-xanthine permease [Oscillospiraceae bacterium]|nr:uracil-xanthine permease [Oscillospiraceae bacterium]